MRPLFAALAASCIIALPASAQELSISARDTVQSLLAAQKGKRVTVRLSGGQEITGVVREATDKLVALGALTGREFFDAAIPIDKVEAVIVRTKQ